MTVAVAFKARKPELLDDYFAARGGATARFHELVSAFEKTVGGKEALIYTSFDGGRLVLGFHAGRFCKDIPAGWKLDGKYNAVPAKRTTEGQAIARRLKDLRLEGNTYPGAPNVMYAEGYAIFPIYPQVHRIGDTYYLTLRKAPRTEKGHTLDPEIWEPTDLTQFHAALEQETENRP